jgi:hypothetical protein
MRVRVARGRRDRGTPTEIFAERQAVHHVNINTEVVMAIKKPKIQHDDVDRMPYFPEKSDRYVLVQNGTEVFRGTHADCYSALLKRQSRSTAYALRFGGWECKHISQLTPENG